MYSLPSPAVEPGAPPQEYMRAVRTDRKRIRIIHMVVEE
jgi:hypothetical protein